MFETKVTFFIFENFSEKTLWVNSLTTNVSHHINQSTDVQCKSIDWFLYDGEHWPLMC